MMPPRTSMGQKLKEAELEIKELKKTNKNLEDQIKTLQDTNEKLEQGKEMLQIGVAIPHQTVPKEDEKVPKESEKASKAKKKKRSSDDDEESSEDDGCGKWACRKMRQQHASLWGKQGLLRREATGKLILASGDAFRAFLVRPDDSLVGPWACLCARVAVLRSSPISGEQLAEVSRMAREGIEISVSVGLAFVLFELAALFLVWRHKTFNQVSLQAFLVLAAAPKEILKQCALKNIGQVGTQSFVSSALQSEGAETLEGFKNPADWNKGIGVQRFSPQATQAMSVVTPSQSASNVGGHGGWRGGRGGRGFFRGEQRGEKRCYLCQQLGHIARECAAPPVSTVGGKESVLPGAKK